MLVFIEEFGGMVFFSEDFIVQCRYMYSAFTYVSKDHIHVETLRSIYKSSLILQF